MLFWVSAARFPPISVRIATQVSSGRYSGRKAGRPQRKMRSSYAQPAAFTATDMNPVIDVGAPS